MASKGTGPGGKFMTFVRFIAQQRREAGRIAAGLPPAPSGALTVHGGEPGWTATGFEATAGQCFKVTSAGAVWLSKPLALAVEPRTALWVRIGGQGPIRKMLANECVFEAWASGPVEVMIKALTEWADGEGGLLPGARKKLGGGISVIVEPSSGPADVASPPADWSYLWRLGDGRIYTGRSDDITVSTHGDVGILQRDLDVPLTGETLLEWEWLVKRLPSQLPENLALTHDYLSIAVEFENGLDLTYMWSAGLPHNHSFRCPLPWWCERETHWVARSGDEGMGTWQSERRTIAADYAVAIGGPLPKKIVRVWLIANTIFQRGHGEAQFRSIRVY